MMKTVVSAWLVLVVAGFCRPQAKPATSGITGESAVSQWEIEEIERQLVLELRFTMCTEECGIDIDMNGVRPSDNEKERFIRSYMSGCVKDLRKSPIGALTGKKTDISAQSKYDVDGTANDPYACAIIPIATRQIRSIQLIKKAGMVRSYEFLYTFSPAYPTLSQFTLKEKLKGSVECLVSEAERTFQVRRYRVEDRGIGEFTNHP